MALTLFAVNNGYFDDVDGEQGAAVRERRCAQFMKSKYAAIMDNASSRPRSLEATTRRRCTRRSRTSRRPERTDQEISGYGVDRTDTRLFNVGESRAGRSQWRNRRKGTTWQAARKSATKIKSVQNTRKITKAMEMVAASKMRKAQERMRAARPYAEQDPPCRRAHRRTPTPNTSIRSW